MQHVNARMILPGGLLRKIQKYCSGYIYVPSTREFYTNRRKLARRLAGRGLSVPAIAGEVHVGERRVRQILAEGRDGK